jgi:hypothetical protein
MSKRPSAIERLGVLRNEALRAALVPLFSLAALRARRGRARRLADHVAEQARLRARYGLGPDTPIQPWGEQVEAAVRAWAATQRGVRFAATSGSTARPKRIPYTPARLAALRRVNLEAAAEIGRVHAVRRPVLFVFSALRDDDSLSSLLLEDHRRSVSLLSGLIMPSRYSHSDALAPLLAEHGPTAVRLWLLLLCDPGLLYSTNPSTLAGFLAALQGGWEESAGVVRAHVAGALPPAARAVARRVAGPGWLERLRLAADAPALPPLERLLPALRCYVCWDGGYVRPFLERIQRHLPATRYAHVPMYSMSTETIETVPHWEGRREGCEPRFLPLAPGVLYELLPEDAAPDDPTALLPTRAAVPGQTYALVVSDAHGLVRYHTGDLFHCAGRVGDAPDLRFLRRQGLAYSFTGEKLTGEQVSLAYERLRAARPALGALGVQLTLFPSLAGADAAPCYRLVLAHPSDVDPAELPADGAGAAFDALLGEVNGELRAKQRSGRLGPTREVVLPYEALAAALDGRTDATGRAWENQFKLLPLYTRRWEDLAALGRKAA